MLIWLHVVLQAGVILTPFGLLPFQWRRSRSLAQVAIFMSPFLLIGAVSVLLMNANGFPTLEWILPAAVTGILTLSCRSDRVLTWMRGFLVAAAVVLCANFLFLVGESEYTSVPKWPLEISETQKHRSIAAGRDAVEKKFSIETTLEAGSLAKILNEPWFENQELLTVEKQWHTPLTRLYLIKRERAHLWYPGGEVRFGSRALELRKTGS
ncbi:MAG: hypothetical protein EXR98_01685 [Gemmataceae bacterium]|nr:hypothetical protein [Gemmataceae bacterium]